MEERKIKFDRKVVLGEGAFGSVYLGTFEGRQVAVKRILKKRVNEREEIAMRSLDHPNVIKLFHCENDDDFGYYALELCVASLDKLFLQENHPRKYKGPMPLNIEVFLQLASGLEHIHSRGFTHRDIKPQNILIATTPNGQEIEITMKWADFGLSNPVNERGTYTMIDISGTEDWYAPEIIELLMQENGTTCRGTNKSDVFVLALVFGYLLLKGEHLYGSSKQEIKKNITEGKPINIEKMDDKHKFYETKLLTKMLHDDPSIRITMTEVVNQLKFIDIKFTKKDTNMLQLCSIYLQLDLKIEDLIHFGIDVNKKNNFGWNALHYLCANSSNSKLVDAIPILIQSGIDVKSTTDDGSNALHYLCRFHSNSELVNAIPILIQSGIDVNAKDNDGCNALHYLCRKISNSKLVDAIKILIQSGFDVKSTTDDGSNALHYLCRYSSNLELVNAIPILIQSGIDVNAKDNDGCNALVFYCHSGRSVLEDAIKQILGGTILD